MNDIDTIVINVDPDTIRECLGNPDLTDDEARSIGDEVRSEVYSLVEILMSNIM